MLKILMIRILIKIKNLIIKKSATEITINRIIRIIEEKIITITTQKNNIGTNLATDIEIQILSLMVL
jgi:hypothetical protein